MGVEIPPAGFVAGLDLVRGDDGELQVLEDNMRTPSGIGLHGRRARRRGRPRCRAAHGRRRDPAAAFEMLGQTLRAAAPRRGDPSVVLLSDGPPNSAWWEHREIARAARHPPRSPRRPVRARRAPARRAGERPARARWTWSIAAPTRTACATTPAAPHGSRTSCSAPVRRGTLAVVNPFGAGVADDKLVHAYVEEMVRFYLGEEPLLRSVRTLRPRRRRGARPTVSRDRRARGEAAQRLRRRRAWWSCPHALARTALRWLAMRVAAARRAWIAQEMVDAVDPPDRVRRRLEPRHVDLRPFVIGAREERGVRGH